MDIDIEYRLSARPRGAAAAEGAAAAAVALGGAPDPNRATNRRSPNSATAGAARPSSGRLVAGPLIAAAGYRTGTRTLPTSNSAPTTPSSPPAKSPSRPKFSGDLTAVPVTDNQHAGARRRDRPHRRPRLPHRARRRRRRRSPAAQAGIQNIDAQIAVQEAQIDADQAQGEQAQASLTFAGRSSRMRTGENGFRPSRTRSSTARSASSSAPPLTPRRRS